MKKITFLLLFLTAFVGYAQPTTNPAAPTNDAADVISIYGDTFTNVANNYDPNWGQSGHMQVNPNYDPGTGQLLLAYPNFNYQGTELTAQNASGMEFLHIDIWTSADPGATDIQVSPINAGSGAGETLVSIAYTTGTWTSVDIPKSSFTGMTWDNVVQMKFAANGPGSTVPVDIYLDNIYFWKAPLAPGSDATLSDLQVDGQTVPTFNSAVFDYTYELVVGTTTVPQITMATTTDMDATVTSINQAPSIPGDATVEVTSQNGNVMETYTISFQATLPNSSPTPSTPDAEVLALLADITDTGGFTTYWNPSYYFGQNSGTPDLDPSGAVNKSIKMDFSVAGWGGGINNGADVYTDVSAYGYLNFSYFAPNEAAGVNGHEFYFDIIGGGASPGGTGAGEFFYIFRETGQGGDADITFGEWVNVSVPLSHFVNQGWTTDNFFQFKLGSASDLNTKVVYFDNIYFSVNEGTTLSTTEINAIADFNVYPNPTQNVWNVKTNNQNINSIQLFDVQGRQVLTIEPNANQAVIDASSLPTGLYFAQINADSGSKSIKLIKQ